MSRELIIVIAIVIGAFIGMAVFGRGKKRTGTPSPAPKPDTPDDTPSVGQ